MIASYYPAHRGHDSGVAHLRLHKYERQQIAAKLSRKKNRAVSITKPTSDEQQFLLQSLGGNVPVISHQPPVDHDYSEDVISRTVNFEHAYTAR